MVRWSSILASTRDSMKVLRYCGRPSACNHSLPTHSWFMSPNARVVRDVLGAEGEVSDTISCIASRSFRRCKGLLMPISRRISASLSADMIAPDLTLALQAATYQAGIPTHSSSHATMVGPFHRAKGVPAFMASASSSWRYPGRLWYNKGEERRWSNVASVQIQNFNIISIDYSKEDWGKELKELEECH